MSKVVDIDISGQRASWAALRIEEIGGSAALAGAPLDAAEVRTLLERGRAVGGHALDAYLLVRDYASAATWAAERARRPEPLRLDDLRELHRRAAPGPGAGGWRTANLRALPDGTVPTPYWMVPFEAESLAGRLALDDALPAPAAIARALARLHRLQPFGRANGRVARLVALTLALRRGLPPPALDARARSAFRAALVAADAGRPALLEALYARVLARAGERIAAAGETAALLPFGVAITGRGDPAAWYKAAQRGRVRTVRRGGRLYTTREWVDAYAARRASRSATPP